MYTDLNESVCPAVALARAQSVRLDFSMMGYPSRATRFLDP